MTASELKELRISAGLTMADAARLFKVPYRTWQNWENGDRRVPPMAGVILEMYKNFKALEYLQAMEQALIKQGET